MEKFLTALVFVGTTLVLLWSSVFVCIVLDLYRGKSILSFRGGGKYHVPRGETVNPFWRWLLRIFVMPLFVVCLGTFMVAFIPPHRAASFVLGLFKKRRHPVENA